MIKEIINPRRIIQNPAELRAQNSSCFKRPFLTEAEIVKPCPLNKELLEVKIMVLLFLLIKHESFDFNEP